MGIWFSSDQHFGHENVLFKFCTETRPFTTMEEMHEMFVKYHNDVVLPDDIYYCVGDFSLAMGWVDKYAKRLNGKKHLVPGNHDWVHSCHAKKPQKMEQARRRFVSGGFTVLPEQNTLLYKNYNIKICHLPYWDEPLPGQEYEGRYKELRPKPENEDFLFCGHVHQTWKFKEHQASKKVMCNVGVDVWGCKPVHIDDVLKAAEEFKTHL